MSPGLLGRLLRRRGGQGVQLRPVEVTESGVSAGAPSASGRRPAEAEPVAEISPVRLDQALERLRAENPAPSGEGAAEASG